MTTFQRVLRLSLVPVFVLGTSVVALRADEAPAEPKPPVAPAAPADPQAPAEPAAPAGAQLFDTPDAAIQALAAALEANDDDAMRTLVGPGSEDLIQSGKDPIVARERRRVATLIAEKVTWEELDDGTQVPVVGIEAWPMPVPLAKKDGKWFFDAVQGRDEVLARRIGTGELRTMSLMRALAEAQEAYKAKDRDGDGVLEYAQKFVSTGDAHDGLFWVDTEDVSLEDRSPLGAMVEELTPYLDGKSKGAPFGGYLFKILTAQGCNAVGGAQTFLSGENLTGGFVIVAVPAEYRVTGVMSFVITHRGRLVEKDLGPKGAELFKAATVFDPAQPWTASEEPK